MDSVLRRDDGGDGFTRKELRHPRWWSPTRGVVMVAADADDLGKRCRAVALALDDDAVFVHVTAAQLRGWWLPTQARRWPMIACTSGTAPHHDRRGVYVRRCGIPATHRTMLDGVRVESAEWNLLELAEDLALIDLVVVVDAALHLKDCTKESLVDALVPGRRGVARLRGALALADGRSESPWETVLRLVHVLSGITDVEPQSHLRDETGQIVARGDLRLGHSRRVAEYDGGVHRPKEQHERDLRRDKLLARLGFQRYGYTATEIHHNVHQIVRDAEDALGLERDPTRVNGWLQHYRRSTLSATGRAALSKRMRRFDREHSPRRRTF